MVTTLDTHFFTKSAIVQLIQRCYLEKLSLKEWLLTGSVNDEGFFACWFFQIQCPATSLFCWVFLIQRFADGNIYIFLFFFLIPRQCEINSEAKHRWESPVGINGEFSIFSHVPVLILYQRYHSSTSYCTSAMIFWLIFNWWPKTWWLKACHSQDL